MGRKVHPIGFRLGINQPWSGRWFAEGAEYRTQLHQDIVIRKMISKEAEKAGISTIEIERFGDKVKVSIHTAKPGILIGRKGDSVKKIRTDLEALTGKKIDLEIKEIKAAGLRRPARGEEHCRTDRTPCELPPCHETGIAASHAPGS